LQAGVEHRMQVRQIYFRAPTAEVGLVFRGRVRHSGTENAVEVR
jgi:hypothetical protein